MIPAAFEADHDHLMIPSGLRIGASGHGFSYRRLICFAVANVPSNPSRTAIDIGDIKRNYTYAHNGMILVLNRWLVLQSGSGHDCLFTPDFHHQNINAFFALHIKSRPFVGNAGDN